MQQQLSKPKKLAEVADYLAHEVKNPLATIELRSSQLRNLLDESSDQLSARTLGQCQKFLDVIDQNIARIVHVIDGLKSDSEASSGTGSNT